MRNINFKQPRYIMPLLALPFLILFFYVYRSNAPAEEAETVSGQKEGMQENIGQASEAIQKSGFSDKLDAFRNQYKEADGNTAINPIQDEAALDSIDRLMKARFSTTSSAAITDPAAYRNSGMSSSVLQNKPNDDQLAMALMRLNSAQSNPGQPVEKQKDPMEIFKEQMAYLDSVNKAQDPERIEQEKKDKVIKETIAHQSSLKLKVCRAENSSSAFNTLIPEKKEGFITAIIDENLTGYAGSRIRLRLLEDIMAGKILVKKGTYLYAEITGFSGQRVALGVSSILSEGKILPVKLELYDLDGLSGLYVPESAFREFSKDLGGNSMQGVNIQGTAQNQSQFLMSTIDKMFQSTSSAIANLIRKNKAKIKYSSFIYLIDPEQLQDQQKNY